MTCSVRISGLFIAAVRPERLSEADCSVDWVDTVDTVERRHTTTTAAATADYSVHSVDTVERRHTITTVAATATVDCSEDSVDTVERPRMATRGINGYGQPNGGGSMLSPCFAVCPITE